MSYKVFIFTQESKLKTMTTIYIILFLCSFGMALVGVYMTGFKNGKKDVLDDLYYNKYISLDTYKRFKKLDV